MSLSIGKISRIDKESVLQICSSQVVLDLATAVKELVENSLDAGATQIEIRVRENGAGGVEVQDNGSGVAPEDYAGLTKRYATSKIREFGDVAQVSSFGFRGEALSSICSLSKLSVKTKRAEDAAATELEFDRLGNIVSQKGAPGDRGTTIIIKDLFLNLPVRRTDFLKNIKREYNKLIESLTGYALVCSNIKFIVFQVDKKGVKNRILYTTGSGAMKDTISALYGSRYIQNLLEVDASSDVASISGYVSKMDPKVCRGNSDHQWMFLNQRPIDVPRLSRAINEVYRSLNAGLIKSNQYPSFILNLTVPSGEFDVNVTPDKKLVLFHREQNLVQFIQTTLFELFEGASHSYEAQSIAPSKSGSFVDEGDLVLAQQQIPPGQKSQLDNIYESVPVSPTEAMVRRALFLLPSRPDFYFCERKDVDSPPTSTPIVHAHNGSCNHGHSEDYSEPERQSASSSSPPKVPIQTLLAPLPPPASNAPRTIAKVPAVTVPTQQQKLSGPDAIRQRMAQNIASRSTVSLKPTAEAKVRESQDDIVVVTDGDIYIQEDNTNKKETSAPRCIQVSLDRIRNSMKKRMQQQSGDNDVDAEKQFRTKMVISGTKEIEKELTRLVSKEDFGKMEVVGQFNNAFIIGQLGSDLFILDQHASDEKYNYEQLQLTTTFKVQPMIHPLQLELTAMDELVVMDNLDIFRANGFDFTIDHDAPPTRRIKLSSYFFSKGTEFGMSDVMELVSLLRDRPGEMVRIPRINSMIASRACRKSIMFGTPLKMAEMNAVVRHMGEMVNPWSCPHGRPTMRHLIDLRNLPTAPTSKASSANTATNTSRPYAGGASGPVETDEDLEQRTSNRKRKTAYN